MRDPGIRRWVWLILPFLAFGIGIQGWKSAWGALLLYHALLAIPLTLHRPRWPLRRLMKGISPRWIIGHVVGIAIVFLGLYELAQQRNFEGPVLRRLVGGFGGLSWTFPAYFLLINPIVEELFWRDLLARRTRWLTIEDLAFGAFHAFILAPFVSWPFILGGVIGLTTMGYLWRQIRWQTDGLFIPWFGHLLGDGMFIALVAVLIR